MSNSEAVSTGKITQAMDGVNGLGLFCIQQYSDIVGRFQSNVEFVQIFTFSGKPHYP